MDSGCQRCQSMVICSIALVLKRGRISCWWGRVGGPSPHRCWEARGQGRGRDKMHPCRAHPNNLLPLTKPHLREILMIHLFPRSPPLTLLHGDPAATHETRGTFQLQTPACAGPQRVALMTAAVGHPRLHRPAPSSWAQRGEVISQTLLRLSRCFS